MAPPGNQAANGEHKLQPVAMGGPGLLDKKGERVYINKDQYFEGLEENIWQYQIGGYQVCNKWLKDRTGRILSLDDVKHYCKVATAIERTINIQKSIDEIYNEAEKKLIDF